MTLPYGHTNLLVAALLLEEAASFIETSPDELSLKVCEALVNRVKEHIGA